MSGHRWGCSNSLGSAASLICTRSPGQLRVSQRSWEFGAGRSGAATALSPGSARASRDPRELGVEERASAANPRRVQDCWGPECDGHLGQPLSFRQGWGACGSSSVRPPLGPCSSNTFGCRMPTQVPRASWLPTPLSAPDSVLLPLTGSSTYLGKCLLS